jgi:hypothetical protein
MAAVAGPRNHPNLQCPSFGASSALLGPVCQRKADRAENIVWIGGWPNQLPTRELLSINGLPCRFAGSVGAELPPSLTSATILLSSSIVASTGSAEADTGGCSRALARAQT